VLWGKSGKAKTDFAMAQGKYPLLVDEIDKLKEISPDKTDLLVFDDMGFGPKDLNWTPLQVIRLLDTKKERVIKCRYTNAKRPKDIKMIFCTNLVPPEVTEANNWTWKADLEGTGAPTADWIFPRGTNKEQDIAIRRRYRLEGPVERMLATPTSSWGRFAMEMMEKKEATKDNATEPL
jgi:hypothetical protein